MQFAKMYLQQLLPVSVDQYLILPEDYEEVRNEKACLIKCLLLP
jgi:hypothetical protein